MIDRVVILTIYRDYNGHPSHWVNPPTFVVMGAQAYLKPHAQSRAAANQV